MPTIPVASLENSSAARTTSGRVVHPLIAYLTSRLKALAEIVTLEYDGRPVEFDGFRLRHLAPWVIKPDRSLLQNFGSISGYCNMRCNFCYEFGNPLPYDLTMLGVKEARTRAKYYNPRTRRGLLNFSERLGLEPFTNPRLLDILTVFRSSNPDQVISLTTNGAFLDDAMLAKLAVLAPIYLVISLNTSDPQHRQITMHDGQAHTVLAAINQLPAFNIPFTGTIVAWPDIPAEELRQTIHFLDEHQARLIRVSLPSYSGYFSAGKKLFNTPQEWERLFYLIESVADKITTPISAVPYLFQGIPLTPLVAGVIRNSPAARAGIQRGDIIHRVQGLPIRWRMQGKRLLNEQIQRSDGVVNLEIERGGQIISFVLDDRISSERNLYPYKPKGYKSPYHLGESYGSLLGLFLNDDLNPDDLLKVVSLAHQHAARSVAVLTSPLLEEIVSTLFVKNPILEEATRDLEVIIVSPSHNFWGGNILVGDLYLCSDYIDCLQKIEGKLGKKPDLAVIPSTFSSNGWTDLAGVPYSEIEIQTGIRVELLPCSRIIV